MTSISALPRRRAWSPKRPAVVKPRRPVPPRRPVVRRPTAAKRVPTIVQQFIGRRARGVSGYGLGSVTTRRLTPAEDAEMTGLQQLSIENRERDLGRKLTNTERLEIIGTVQRNYMAGKGVRGGFVGPGGQTFAPKPGQTFDLDAVLKDRKQTPVNLVRQTGREIPGVVRDGVTAVTTGVADTFGAAAKGVLGSPWGVAIAAGAVLYFIAGRTR